MLRRFGLLLLVVLCGAGCPNRATPPTPSGPPPNLTRANFEKIREGMTVQEVETILGPPQAWGGRQAAGSPRRPDWTTWSDQDKKELESASWFWVRSSASPDGRQREERRSIVVQLKEGKVTTKEQVGLE
jgi:hypothetical protein